MIAHLLGRGADKAWGPVCTVAHWVAVLVHAGLGEQHPEFDLSGPGPTVGVLTGPPGGVGGHGRDAGAVHRDVELRDRCALSVASPEHAQEHLGC